MRYLLAAILILFAQPALAIDLAMQQSVFSNQGPPKPGLLKYVRPVNDTISLSTSYYDQVETYWQGVLYDPGPTQKDVAVSTIQADGNVNTTTVWSTARGTAVYADGTSAATLTRVASWFGVASEPASGFPYTFPITLE